MKRDTKTTKYKLKSKENIDLNLTIWDNDAKTEKLLVITHGYGEHQGYYKEFAKYFVKKGFIVCTYDLRSHGESGGKQGHVAPFQLFLDDLDSIIDFVLKEKEVSKLYLFGHSMGGSITMNYLMKNDDKKVVKAIISSPWLKLAFEPPKSKLLLAKIGKLLFPSLPIKGELDTKNLSRNIEFSSRFEDDILTYDKISPLYFFEIRNAGLWVLENYTKLKTPILMSHGDDDKITSIKASKYFCSKSPEYCKFKEWSGGYKHVVFSEDDKDKIFDYYHSYLVSK